MRVARFEQNALDAGDIADVLRLDRNYIFRNTNNAARADEFRRVKLVDALCTFDKVVRRVNVRAGVDAKRDLTDIGR